MHTRDAPFEVGPDRDDEEWEVTGLELVLVGPDVATRIGDFGGQQGRLELGFSCVAASELRDLGALLLLATETRREWNAGTFQGAVADAEAARYEDGTARLGLRGPPQIHHASELKQPPSPPPRAPLTNLELDNEVIELRRHGTNDVVKRFQLDPKARTCIETPPELRRRGATGPFP